MAELGSPNMLWDGTTRWLADIAVDGMLFAAQAVAGGLDESIFQSEWSPARDFTSSPTAPAGGTCIACATASCSRRAPWPQILEIGRAHV